MSRYRHLRRQVDRATAPFEGPQAHEISAGVDALAAGQQPVGRAASVALAQRIYGLWQLCGESIRGTPSDLLEGDYSA